MKPKKRQIEVTFAQREALSLRRDGKSYGEIAEAMGISRHRAYELVQKALKKIIREPAEHVIELELERLDKLLEGIWPKAISGDIPAVMAALKIMERRAKLLGLDKHDGQVVLIDSPTSINTQINIDWVQIVKETQILEAIKRSLDQAPTGESVGNNTGSGAREFRDLPFIRRDGPMEAGGAPVVDL